VRNDEWSHRATGLSGDYRVDPEQHRMSYPECEMCRPAPPDPEGHDD